MNFNWNKFTEEKYKTYLKELEAKAEYIDYIGTIHVGDIAIDLVDHREVGKLFIDFYVLYEDTGYGYTKDDVPYDFAEGFEIECPLNLSYKEFKEKTEKLCIEYILEYKGNYNLFEHANNITKEW